MFNHLHMRLIFIVRKHVYQNSFQVYNKKLYINCYNGSIAINLVDGVSKIYMKSTPISIQLPTTYFIQYIITDLSSILQLVKWFVNQNELNMKYEQAFEDTFYLETLQSHSKLMTTFQLNSEKMYIVNIFSSYISVEFNV